MSQSPQLNQEQKRRAGVWTTFLCLGAIIAVGIWLFGDLDDESFTDSDSDLYSSAATYSGQSIPNFTAREEQRLSEALSEYEQTYGSCFGWTLEDGATGNLQFGSSRGPDVRATSCSSWVEVRVGVGYTSATSPNYDAAAISLVASSDLPQAGEITRDDFVELGIDADALISAPVTVTGHAALAAPLLLIQAGALEQVEQPQDQVGPSNPPQALPESDDLAFPVSTALLLAALGAGAVAAIVAGVRAARRE